MKKKVIVGVTFVIFISLLIFICIYEKESDSKSKVVSTKSQEDELREIDEKTDIQAVEKDTINEDEINVDENKSETINDEGIENNAISIEEAPSNNSTDDTSGSDANVNAQTSSNNETNTTNNNQNTVSTPEIIKSIYKDGTFSGEAEGYNGLLQVKVTIASDNIKSIVIVETEDDEPFITEAEGVISKIISAQNVDVDVVSGATYSSKGIINATKAALTKAKN